MKKVISCVVFSLIAQFVCSMENGAATVPVGESSYFSAKNVLKAFGSVAIGSGVSVISKNIFKSKNSVALGVGVCSGVGVFLLSSLFNGQKHHETDLDTDAQSIAFIDDESNNDDPFDCSFSSVQSTCSISPVKETALYTEARRVFDDRFKFKYREFSVIRSNGFALSVIDPESLTAGYIPGMVYFSRSDLFIVGNFVSSRNGIVSLNFGAGESLDIVSIRDMSPMQFTCQGFHDCSLSLKKLAKLRKLVVLNNFVGLLSEDRKISLICGQHDTYGHMIYMGNFCYKDGTNVPIPHGKGMLWSEDAYFRGNFKNGMYVGEVPVPIQKIRRFKQTKQPCNY